MRVLLGNISWRFRAVWQRNWDVYLATWKTNLLPPTVELLFYLFAFGLGLGGLLAPRPGPGAAGAAGAAGGFVILGHQLHYLQFLVPGVLAMSVMFSAFFECTYGSFVRMYYQKTFDGIIATPVMLEEVILGEIVWGATLGALRVVLILLLLGAVDLVAPLVATGFPRPLVVWPAALLTVPVAFAGGLVFAALGMCFTAYVPKIDAFNYANSLFVTPLFLFSGAFFPLAELPGWFQRAAELSPLTELVEVFRPLMLGELVGGGLWRTALLLALGPPLTLFAIWRMKQRLII